MRWREGGGSGNIEDRRGMGGVAGVGIGGIILAIIGYAVFGIDPSQTMSILGGVSGEQEAGKMGPPTDEEGQFVSQILGSSEEVWASEFQQSGMQYEPTTTVLYTQGTMTGCGIGQAAMGPFYCPQDKKIYIDLSFFRQLESEFAAPGEFARAYVIAHEVGHHVQNLLGVHDRVASLGGPESGEGSNAVRVELQADCYAGVWAKRSNDARRWIEGGDVEAGLRAASAVGDDTIQQRTQGQVVPDGFTHGSAEQRMRWFTIGYESGNAEACDTFSASRL